MSAEVLIAIPVLGRPASAGTVYESATAGTDVPHRVLFLCSPGDDAEIAACRATGADVAVCSWTAGPGDWAKKINAAFLGHLRDELWIFTGADDLRFHPGWASEALRVGEETGVGVVGTCDGGHNPRVRRGEHSTHSLVCREYATAYGTADGQMLVLSEEYDHQYADDELVETAKARDQWAFAEDACVEHLHPYFGKAQMDETYEKALRATQDDRLLFERRRRLWEETCG